MKQDNSREDNTRARTARFAQGEHRVHKSRVVPIILGMLAMGLFFWFGTLYQQNKYSKMCTNMGGTINPGDDKVCILEVQAGQ